jgi:hypothetical protein
MQRRSDGNAGIAGHHQGRSFRFSPFTSHISRLTKRSASACLRSGSTLQLARLVSPNHQTKITAIADNAGNGNYLEEPLNLGTEQPAVVGVAVVRRRKATAATGTFFDRRRHALEGV